MVEQNKHEIHIEFRLRPRLRYGYYQSSSLWWT